MTETNLEVVKDYEALCDRATEFILERVASQPGLSMLVPTGTTPEGVYARLSTHPAEIRGVSLFNYDEYCESVNGNGTYELIDPDHPQSYRRYMAEHLLDAVPELKARSFFPGIQNADRPGHYDRLIAARGGIDLALNAIGEDGHTFGFNFPDQPFGSRSRRVAINSDTKRVNEGLTEAPVPDHAVTAGLATGLSATEVLVLVSGSRKAAILKRIMKGPVTPQVPATILHRHPYCKWLVDEAAAALL